jgi:hypothetical protein
MYVVQRRRGFGGLGNLGSASALPTIGELRVKLKKRLDQLRVYDLYLRDRSVAEWFKDNSIIANWLRTSQSRDYHKESHEFWSHLDDGEKRQLVGKWIDLIERGRQLSGDARQGGIGVGYGPSETAPPARAQSVSGWLAQADDFIASFEKLRQRMRVEARVDTNPVTSWLGNAMRPLVWTLGLGVVGLVAFNMLSQRRH